MTHAFVKWVAAAIAVLLLLLFFLIWGDSPKTKEEAVEKAAYTAFGFDPALKSRYTLAFDQNSSLLASDMLPARVGFDYTIRATLNLRVLETGGESVWLGMQLSDFDLQGPAVDGILSEALLPYYRAMFLVRMDRQGRIEALRFPGKGTNFSGLSQLVYLLETLNLPRANYRQSEDDGIGAYTAYYRRIGETIRKRKAEYTQVISPEPTFRAHVDRSQVTALPDAAGNWLKHFELDEQVGLTDGQGAPYARNRNHIVLRKQDRAVDDALEIWRERRSVAAILKAFEAAERGDADVFERILRTREKTRFVKGGITFERMASYLENASDPDRFREMGKFITAFPDQTHRLKTVIVNGSDYTAMHLIGMLEMVGTPEAQRLLGDLAGDESISQMNRLRAIIALGGAASPQSGTVETLTILSMQNGGNGDREIAHTALLALASQADKAEDPAAIRSQIRAEYYANPSLEEEKALLYAMQNAGAEQFLTEIEASSKSESLKIREIAVQTLGTIEDKGLREAHLEEQLGRQENEKIRDLIRNLLGR